MSQQTRRQALRSIGIGSTIGVVGLAGCPGGVSTNPNIDIKADTFEPKNTRVSTDQPVAWNNVSDEVHVVKSASSNWDFEVEVPPGEATSHDFFSQGIYDVVCPRHGDPDEFSGQRMRIAVGMELEDPID